MQNGLLIARFRIKYNLSQQDVANILHISLKTYKNYEANIRLIPLENLNKISVYFNISLDCLLGLSKKNHCIKKEIDYQKLKYNLWFIRKKSHIKIKKLACEFKITSQSIINYEKKDTPVSITYLYNIAKKFQISVDYLCGKSTKKEIL